MNTVKNYFQHRFNPLHLYCRLKDFGMAGRIALKMSAIYERLFYRPSSLGK